MFNLRVPNITLKRLSEIGDDIEQLLYQACRIPDLVHDIKQYKLRIDELESENKKLTYQNRDIEVVASSLLQSRIDK